MIIEQSPDAKDWPEHCRPMGLCVERLQGEITRLRALVESSYYEGARNRSRAERGVPTVELWALSESKRKSEGEG